MKEEAYSNNNLIYQSPTWFKRNTSCPKNSNMLLKESPIMVDRKWPFKTINETYRIKMWWYIVRNTHTHTHTNIHTYIHTNKSYKSYMHTQISYHVHFFGYIGRRIVHNISFGERNLCNTACNITSERPVQTTLLVRHAWAKESETDITNCIITPVGLWGHSILAPAPTWHSFLKAWCDDACGTIQK